MSLLLSMRYLLPRAKASPSASRELTVDGLVAAYGRMEVLHSVSLRVGAGEAVAILGANGAGKTTLLRSLSVLLRPAGGSARFGAIDLARARPDEILRAGIAHV